MKVKIMARLLAMGMALCLLTSCAKPASASAGIPLSYDDQIREGGIQDDGMFNKALFFRNDTELRVADPQVIHISDTQSEEYGYYYLYGTTSPDAGYEAYRSKDLQEWEALSPLKGFLAFTPPENNIVKQAFWAPEVIYDAEKKLYYMFYTGSLSGEGDWGNKYPCVAVAEQPYGPFVPSTEAGLDATKLLIDKTKANAAVDPASRGDWIVIDQSPFVGADGNRYLLFCRVSDPGDNGKDSVWGVKMNSWSEPDYSTLVRLMSVGYLTPDKAEKAEYESGSPRNEGPHMYVRKRDDGTVTYYLTASINGLSDYTVIQSVSDSPLGPFRKLTEEEGGIILANDHLQWDHLRGPGHHCFIEAGDELYIVYHQQGDRQNGEGWDRYVAIDRVSFTKNLKGEEVMYINGPTWSLQPQVKTVAEYTNIASQATVTATAGANTAALTDGLLSLYKAVDYVKEFETDETTTITLDFGDYKEIRALMIYNSKWYEKAFPYIDRVEFDFKNDQLPDGETAFIDTLAFDWKSYKNNNVDEMRPGGSAVAVFAPLQVKTIRITLKLPMQRPEELELLDEDGYVVDQTLAAISEIVVLGK